jgi:hypothetical protein
MTKKITDLPDLITEVISTQISPLVLEMNSNFRKRMNCWNSVSSTQTVEEHQNLSDIASLPDDEYTQRQAPKSNQSLVNVQSQKEIVNRKRQAEEESTIFVKPQQKFKTTANPFVKGSQVLAQYNEDKKFYPWILFIYMFLL